jgi:hypothetical protein
MVKMERAYKMLSEDMKAGNPLGQYSLNGRKI